MDTTLSFLGNNTTLVEIGIVLVIAAAVMGLWQAIKSYAARSCGESR